MRVSDTAVPCKRSFGAKYWWYAFKVQASLSKSVWSVCLYSVLRACYFIMICPVTHTHTHIQPVSVPDLMHAGSVKQWELMFLSVSSTLST